jgi:hypothetical protein
MNYVARSVENIDCGDETTGRDVVTNEMFPAKRYALSKYCSFNGTKRVGEDEVLLYTRVRYTAPFKPFPPAKPRPMPFLEMQ